MQNDTAEGAISIKAFCERNGIGMTSAYAEIKAGRLIARKCGNRTLIAKADERAWLNSLPKLHTAAAQPDPQRPGSKVVSTSLTECLRQKRDIKTSR